jgi:hypothetical protein
MAKNRIRNRIERRKYNMDKRELTKLATIAKVTVTCLEIIIKELIEE